MKEFKIDTGSEAGNLFESTCQISDKFFPIQITLLKNILHIFFYIISVVLKLCMVVTHFKILRKLVAHP